MVSFLANIFIKKDLAADEKRNAYGVLCGIVGIFLNLLLFLGKFLAGIISNSIAITADAFNNLSDAGSSVVTLVGFRLAGQKPDPKHPFGHGRMEYISGLAVSAVILIMAFELIRSSVDKIIHPSETEFSVIVIVILLASIAVKCYMAFYNTQVGKKIDSAALRATATDSLSDCIATTAVLIATFVGHYTSLQIDGFCGVIVGIFIFYAGISAAKETIDPLLGQPPEKEFVDEIEQIVTSFDKDIIGIHDLIVHDYGPGRRMISLHAEVPAEGDILELHDIIDNLEKKLEKELGCLTTIHMDPVVTSDKEVIQLKEQTVELVKEIDSTLSLHDFRVVKGNTHTNLIFDVLLSYRYSMSDEELIRTIQDKIKEKFGSQYFAIIEIDKDFNQQED